MRPFWAFMALAVLAVARPALAVSLLDIAHSTTGQSIFVATRDDGAIGRSTNGLVYTVVATGATTPLRGIGYTSGWFVAVGDGGRAIRSSDSGLHWADDNSRTTAALREVVPHSLYFIAVGDAGTTLRKLTAAAVWDTTLSPTNRALYSVASNGTAPGILIAVGDNGRVLRSTDQGLSWLSQTLPGAPNLRGVSGGSLTNYFVAVGLGGRMFRSTNFGATWEDVSISGMTTDLLDVAVDESNRFVAVGLAGTIVRSGTNAAPGTWLEIDTRSSVDLFGVHRDGIYFYAVGGGETVYRSTDGTTWINVPVTGTSWGAVKTLFGSGR